MERPGVTDVAIVIPAHNERGTIAAVVAAAIVHGRVVVTDDGSADGTAELARQAGAEVVRIERSIGYDGALNEGFRRADQLGAVYAVTLDADGQHSPALIPLFVDELRNGACVVFGVRSHPARLAEAAFAWVTRLRYGVRDPLCGMKGYRMEWYRQHGRFDGKRSIGTELGLAAARARKPIAQLPVPISERADTPRFGSAMRANCRIMRALFQSLLL